MSTPVVFLAFANDPDAHLGLLKAESREVFRTLQDLQRRKHIEVHREESADLDELFDDLTGFNDRVAIFHYGGHAESATLQLESGAAGAAGLARLLGDQANLQLVFLNGCSTREQVEGLLAEGVKAVIATSVPIEDDKAKEFAVRFYSALAGRRSIRQAFSLAEAYLEAKYGQGTGDGIKVLRDATPGHAPAEETVAESPWGLYVQQDHEDVLDWTLPSYRAVGLPRELTQYIGESFDTNRHIVGVLDEMARYNPDIFDQMMEQRGEERVRRDSKHYPELIIKNFPWPIGAQIRQLRIHDQPGEERLRKLVSTYRMTATVLYYVMLSDLWEKARTGAVSIDGDTLATPPLDAIGYRDFDFLAGAVGLYGHLEANDIAPYVTEYERLVSDWRDEDGNLRKAHRLLEEWRGQLEEGSLPDAAGLCGRAEQAVAIVLRAAAFFASYRMLTVRDILIKAPRFERVAYELDLGPLNASEGMALNLYQDVVHRTKDGYGNSHSVVLARNEDRADDCLNLSPFILDKNTFVHGTLKGGSAGAKLAHVFILAYEDDGHLTYLSVNHSIDYALANESDRIHTGMTEEDFAEGRNLTAAPDDFDDFGLDADLGLDAGGSRDDSPRVFALLQEQFEGFKADMTGIAP